MTLTAAAALAIVERIPESPDGLRSPEEGPLAEAALFEHGTHDQKSHGRRGGGLAAMQPARWQDVGRITAFGREYGPEEALEAFEMAAPAETGEGKGPRFDAKDEAASGLANEMLADDARLKAMCSDPPSKMYLDREEYSGYYHSSNPVEDFMLQGSTFAIQRALPGDVTARGPEADALLRARREEGVRLQDIARQWGTMTPEEREQVLRTDEAFRYGVAAGYIKHWQITAADNTTVALAIQHAVSAEFGLAGPPSAQHIGSGRDPAAVIRKAAESYADYGQFLTGMVKVTYARTQYELATRGITHVTIARGINSESFRQAIYNSAPPEARNWVTATTGHGATGQMVGVSGVRVSGHPLQSWTLRPGTALNFGMQIMSAKVPASRVFAWPRTGQGCYDEQELVMLGGDSDEVWAGDWQDPD